MTSTPPPGMIDLAIAAALSSPCAKSKRGAVVYLPGGRAHGTGKNGPPAPFGCDGSGACRESCGRTCVHAEMRALANSGLAALAGDYRRRLHLVHVKVESGELVHGKPPCCEQCSRLILDEQIGGVWLYEIDGYRWHFYTALEFHRATLQNLGLYIPLTDLRRPS